VSYSLGKFLGFQWDSLSGQFGNFEIAHGHRLKALQNHIKEVDIPAKNLDGETTLKIMAQENMDEWRTTPIVVMETVKVVFKFMEENQLLSDRTDTDGTALFPKNWGELPIFYGNIMHGTEIALNSEGPATAHLGKLYGLGFSMNRRFSTDLDLAM
jgi:hypothetical protein